MACITFVVPMAMATTERARDLLRRCPDRATGKHCGTQFSAHELGRGHRQRWLLEIANAVDAVSGFLLTFAQ